MLRTRIRHFVENLSGLHIFRVPPRGTDFFYDLERHIPDLHINTVFDVGANVGQSTIRFLKAFPDAKIRAFEPVSRNYAQLRQAVGNNVRVITYNMGLGAEAGTAKMSLDGGPAMSRIVADEDSTPRENVEEVEITRLDSFCARDRVDHIDFLKIDTEGHDLEVLKGAAGLLERSAIDLIRVEAGINQHNSWHVPLEEFVSFLRSYGYDLFAFTEQHPRYGEGTPFLYRADAVFLSARWGAKPA